MGKYFGNLLLITLLLGCNSKTKRNYKYTFKREQNLYIEVYRAGLIGNLTSQYLTDSLTFRLYLGTFDDENARIYCKIDGDDVHVEQREFQKGAGPQLDTFKVVSEKDYNLKELKEGHKFD
jgi:hypothetical protein